MYESQAEQEAQESRAEARKEKSAQADAYHAGEWVAGVLTAAREAPYRHIFGESNSAFANIKTSQGRRQFWGKDIARAIEESKSHVKVGDTVGLRITHTDEFTVVTDKGERETRAFHHFELERATYILGRQRAARRIVEEFLRASRDASKDGKVIAASTLLADAAETLADGYRLNPNHRHGFVEGIKAAAGLSALATEPALDRPQESPTQRAERRRAEDFQRGSWLEGKLVHVEQARYHHNSNGSASTLIKLQTSYGIQPIWGTDLEKAIRRSESEVKVGDKVALRIVQTDKVPVVQADGTSALKPMNRYEIETLDHIARREHLYQKILNDPVRARQAGGSSKVTTGAYLIQKAANMLADAQVLGASERKTFLDGIKAAAAVPTLAAERLQARVNTQPPHRNHPSARDGLARQ